MHDLAAVRENIEVNVSGYFLQVLLNKEILSTWEQQVDLDSALVGRLELLVANGKESEADLYTARATLANTKLSSIQAANTLKLSLIDLAQLINYPEITQFDIVEAVDDLYFVKKLEEQNFINNLETEIVSRRPSVQANLTRIEQSKEEMKMRQAGWYPSLSMFASYGTGYYFMFQENQLYPNLPFGEQLGNNSREMVGLSLNIPIFDKLSTYHSVQSAKINTLNQELQLEETKRNVIKEIQQAYANAVAAQEKYYSAEVAEASAAIALQYETVRYDAGASTIYDFTNAKNSHISATSQLLQAKYDYLFRVKILEVYTTKH